MPHGLPFQGSALGHMDGDQAVKIAAQAAAVVDDDGIAGELQLLGQHDDPRCRGTGGLAGDGIQPVELDFAPGVPFVSLTWPKSTSTI